MKSHRARIENRDGQVFRVPVADAKQNVEVTITDWDLLNGKRGAEGRCALSCAINRETALFPHAVHIANTFKRTIFIADRVVKDNPTHPTHAIRYIHNFNTKRFDLGKRGTMREQKVVLYAPHQRDKLGFRPKSKIYPKATKAAVRRRRPQVGRGLGARVSEQRAWINDFIEKHGPKLPSLHA
jgi:hypothetical protein